MDFLMALKNIWLTIVCHTGICKDSQPFQLVLLQIEYRVMGTGFLLESSDGTPRRLPLFLKEHPKKALIYVCRKSRLAENLSRPGVAAFLAGYGYGELDVDAAIERLKSRFDKGEDFPHEIGVFLDYPLGDVIGFIENSGHNYKCSGCWKVYCDECESRRLFAMYQKCRDIYTRLYEQGRSVFQLTVAA